MCDQATLNALKSKVLSLYQQITGSSTVPAGDPIPGNATPEQIACATKAYVFYILDLSLCLDLQEPQLSKCTTSARQEYDRAFAECFPE